MNYRGRLFSRGGAQRTPRPQPRWLRQNDQRQNDPRQNDQRQIDPRQSHDHYQRSSRNQQSRNHDVSDNEYYDHPDQHQSRDGTYSNSAAVWNQNTQADDFYSLERSFRRQKTEFDQLKNLLAKMSIELDQVKKRVKELESTATRPQVAKSVGPSNDLDQEDERRKSKTLKSREKKAMKLAEKRAAISESAPQQDRQQKILTPEQVATNLTDKTQEQASNPNAEVDVDQLQQNSSNKYNRRTNRERNTDKRNRSRPNFREKAKPLPKVGRNNMNDDSTTQAAEPSSEDRAEGDDGRDGAGKERVRVYRRKKQHWGKRGPYGNRRRRADSSERNSNDTSPQGEANGLDDFPDKRNKGTKKTYPDLSESELSEVVQTLKREFLNLERPSKSIKSTINSKGPKVAYEFAISILDHAICDVTSPTKLSEIANNLYQLLILEDNKSEVDFQQGFYEALSDISKREDDIAIDAPRYLDILGQVLADCVVPMSVEHRYLIKKFLNNCLDFYGQQNRAALLANVMKVVASQKSDRAARDIWDMAQLDWSKVLSEGTDLTEFLESHEVAFTTRAFSPEPTKSEQSIQESEKRAGDTISTEALETKE